MCQVEKKTVLAIDAYKQTTRLFQGYVFNATVIVCVCFCQFPKIYMQVVMRNRKLIWYGLKRDICRCYSYLTSP